MLNFNKIFTKQVSTKKDDEKEDGFDTSNIATEGLLNNTSEEQAKISTNELSGLEAQNKIEQLLKSKNVDLYNKLRIWKSKGFKIKDPNKFLLDMEENPKLDLVTLEGGEIGWGDHKRYAGTNG